MAVRRIISIINWMHELLRHCWQDIWLLFWYSIESFSGMKQVEYDAGLK